MTAFQMYCLIKLDALSVMSAVVWFFSCFTFIIAFIISGCMGDDEDIEHVKEMLIKLRKTAGILLLISTPIAFFMPNTKEAAAIIIVPKVINSTVVQKDLPELYDLAKIWVKDQIKVEVEKK